MSAATGMGIKDLIDAISSSSKTYYTDYLPELKRREEEKARREAEKRDENLQRLVKDMNGVRVGASEGAPRGDDDSDSESAEENEAPDDRSHLFTQRGIPE